MHPSPIQLRAIPLARCGKDLFIQAKSGTGKTIVFVVGILEKFLSSDDKNLQSLIVVPTREISTQVTSVIGCVGKIMEEFSAVSCVGGISVEKDRENVSTAKCIVGTPGRIAHLIRNRMINTNNIGIVVLDEADKLMEDAFKEDIHTIMNMTSNRTQTLVVSATFDARIEKSLFNYMKNPLGVTPKREVPILIGVSQFIYNIDAKKNIIDEMQDKLKRLLHILSVVDYNQCLIFTNSQSRAESYANYLMEKGYLTDFISGALDQDTRQKVFERIKVIKIIRCFFKFIIFFIINSILDVTIL